MEITVEQIAKLIDGEIEGNPQTIIKDVAKIEAGTEGTLSFLANPKYSEFLYTCKSSAIILNKDFKLKQKVTPTLIKVDDAYGAFAKLLELYNSLKPDKTGISPKAVIDETAQIGENVYIAANAYIGKNAQIGDNAKIYPNVYIDDKVVIGKNTTIHANSSIYHHCQIGDNCTIHSGTVIGADGFGFAPQEDGQYKKIPQIGKVILEDDVEIGANTTIDRATMGATFINKGVKIDNLVQIAHNVEIGKHTVIAAQSGIAGSTKIGEYCMIGGQVGISGHLTIADKVKIAAQTGILKSVKQEGQTIMGSPSMDIRQFFKSHSVFTRLPEIEKQIRNYEKK